MAWTIIFRLSKRVHFRKGIVRQLAYPITIAGLIVWILGIHALTLLKAPSIDDAQVMADFIRGHVSQEAVIESWDWQVDALSGHWRFSHPAQLLLLSATQQRFLDQSSFDLPYDLLHADPDYLLTGPFSVWTGIYDPQSVVHDFEPWFEAGPYVLWQRSS
jgi:hypothetical protein